MNKFLRWILWPFALILGAITWFRRFIFYRWLRIRVSFEQPFILVVGNLSLGGTGKTPHTLYLAKLFNNQKMKTGILSRGYGRSSTGYFELNSNDSSVHVGDEPLLYKQNLPNRVFVGEKRVNAIQKIQKEAPEIEILLLDDAFQHLALKANKYILLTTYDELFVDDAMFPVGRLREPKPAAKTADMLIVSKCPVEVRNSPNWQSLIIKKLRNQVRADCLIFFSHYRYGNPIPFYSHKSKELLKSQKVIGFAGIAQHKPFQQHLESHFDCIEFHSFQDHQNYTSVMVESLIEKAKKENAICICTQKDAVKIKEIIEENVWTYFFYIPIEVDFGTEAMVFENTLMQWIEKTT